MNYATAIVLSATVALASAVIVESDGKTVAKRDGDGGGGSKVQKRGLYGLHGLDYGGTGLGYGTLGGYGAGSAIGVTGHAAHVPPPLPAYPTHVHTATTIERQVPVPHPYPVPVEKHVPYPVAAPYPVHVDRPYPVPVPRPYPVAVDRPYPVHVDRPYPVPVPQPYAVPVVKHVGVPVPQPYHHVDAPAYHHLHHRPTYPALPLPYHKPLYSDRDLW